MNWAARILRTLDVRHGEYLVVLSGGISVPAAADQLAKLQEVDFAEPNVLHYINAVPNDEYYTSYDGDSTELQAGISMELAPTRTSKPKRHGTLRPGTQTLSLPLSIPCVSLMTRKSRGQSVDESGCCRRRHQRLRGRYSRLGFL